MPLPFEFLWNAGNLKAATVRDDGLLEQRPEDRLNMRQHWLRLHQQNPADGTFKIINRASNRVIDAIGGSVADGTYLQQYQDTGNRNQRWRIVATDEDPNTFYIHAADTDRVWDLPGTADGDGIWLFTLFNGDYQKWRLHRAEALDNVFEIRSRASDLVLDVPGFSQTDGGFIQQYSANGGFNQQWEIFPVPNGQRTTIRSVCSGRLLDYPLPLAAANQAAQVSQYEDNGGLNQRWRLRVVQFGNRGSDIVNIVSGYPGNDLLLTVRDSLHDPGLHIEMLPDNGGGMNQQWSLTRVS